MPGNALREAADYYYTACELYEDEDLDPGDHLEVVRRAFTSSDCDDFAHALHLVTGWETVRLSWTVGDDFGHHALVRSPEGRLLDVRGWTDEGKLRRRYGAPDATLAASPAIVTTVGDLDDEGLDENLTRVVGVIRALPNPPYATRAFRELSSRPVEGVDAPLPPAPSP